MSVATIFRYRHTCTNCSGRQTKPFSFAL